MTRNVGLPGVGLPGVVLPGVVLGRAVSRGAAWAAVGLAMSGVAHAQVLQPATPAPVSQLWCSARDPAGTRLFVSDPAPSPSTSHLQTWNAGARFLTVVNARDGLTLRDAEHSCHLYRDRASVGKARDILLSHARQHGMQIVTIGAY